MALEAAEMQAAPRDADRTEAWWVYPAIPMLAAAIAFSWFLYADLQRLYGLTVEGTDLAAYQHVVWSIARGDWMHLELILFPIAGIELLWPSPIVLAILSAAGLAAAGPTAYLLFRALLPAERRESALLAVGLATPIPFWAATQQAARDSFHPENLALAFALVAAWAGLRGRRSLLWTFLLLDLACGTDQAYTVIVLALLLRFYGAADIRKLWSVVLYLAALWFLVGAALVQPEFAGSSLQEALLLAGGILASMLGLPLFAPRWLPLAVPPLLAVLFSEHYLLLMMFPLLVAGGIGARRVMARTPVLRPSSAVVVALPALFIGWADGQIPPALLAPDWAYGKPNAVAQLQTAATLIPKDAPVDADASVAVWLANRHTINDFPDNLEASDYVVIDNEAGQLDSASRRTALDALQNGGRSLLYDDGRFQVWSPVGDY